MGAKQRETVRILVKIEENGKTSLPHEFSCFTRTSEKGRELRAFERIANASMNLQILFCYSAINGSSSTLESESFDLFKLSTGLTGVK